MSSSKEFREFAEECLRWADESHDERQRQIFFDLAKLWAQAALQVERSIAIIDDNPPLVPKSPKREDVQLGASAQTLLSHEFLETAWRPRGLLTGKFRVLRAPP